MNDGILCYSHPERRLRTERESVEEWTTILEREPFRSTLLAFIVLYRAGLRTASRDVRISCRTRPPWERQTCQLTWLARPGASGIRCGTETALE